MTEKLYKDFFKDISKTEGSFIYDLDSKELLLSEELCSIIEDVSVKNYNVKEFFDKFVLIDDYDAVKDNFYKSIKDNNISLIFDNLKLRDLHGGIHEVTVRGKLFGDKDNLKLLGEVYKRQLFIGDDSLVRLVLNLIPDSILIIDREKVLFANIPASKMFSYDIPNDMIGKSIFKHIVNHELREAVLSQFKTKEGSVFRLNKESQMISNNNSVIDVEIYFTTIDSDHIMMTIRDIAQRKMLEADKEIKSSRIKEIESNLKLAQEKMISQEKMAGIGQLATGIVHEIFNPLGFVMSNFETLKNYFSDIKGLVDEINRRKEIDKDTLTDILNSHDMDFILEDIDDLFKDVEEGIYRINGIIKNLKKFSRQEKDEFIEYDLNEGIQSTLIVSKNEYKYCADIVTNLGDIPHIRANASKINQVLLNMIVNASHAIKARNEAEKGLIIVTTYKENEYVICEIEDSGIGIPKETYERIFEPFYTTKPVGIGTGLGLSISYDIITKQHMGTINLESEIGKGTKFTIKLPIGEISGESDIDN